MRTTLLLLVRRSVQPSVLVALVSGLYSSTHSVNSASGAGKISLISSMCGSGVAPGGRVAVGVLVGMVVSVGVVVIVGVGARLGPPGEGG
jgi:hypothetical protein